jgi:lysophospholipase L1-like esterase
MNKSAFASCFAALSLLAFAPPAAQAATPADLPIYVARPYDSAHVALADFEAQQVLKGASASVPKDRVQAQVAGKAGEALRLQWKDTWYASLRIEGGAPLDLRPYLAHGVLAFDLDVEDLGKGGLVVKTSCGEHCERKVGYVAPARAAAGKGWQHLAFSMQCFVHEGDDFSAVTEPFALDATGAGTVSIANVRFQASGTPNASCPDYRTESVTPAMLEESWSLDWWLPRHQEKLDEIKRRQAMHEKTDLVFIGDSITHNWEKAGAGVWERNYKQYNGLDLGFGGDRTENILWRLQHGEVDGIHPKVAVLMCGTNNTGSRQEDPKTTAAGIARIVQELRQRLPDTQILLLAVFPRDEKPDSPQRKLNDQVNAIIAGLADDQHVHFLNINAALTNADGTLSRDIMPDLLHPNERGYEIWARAMAPTLHRLMQE